MSQAAQIGAPNNFENRIVEDGGSSIWEAFTIQPCESPSYKSTFKELLTILIAKQKKKVSEMWHIK